VKGGLSRHQAAAPVWRGHQYGSQRVRRCPRRLAAGPDKSAAIGEEIAGPHRDWLMQRCRRQISPCGAGGGTRRAGLKVDPHGVGVVHAEKLSHKKRTLIAAEQDRRTTWLADVHNGPRMGAERSLPPGFID